MYCTTDEPAYLSELADCLEDAEETTLGPTDAHLAQSRFATMRRSSTPTRLSRRPALGQAISRR